MAVLTGAATADNKIYPLRSLRCRSSSRARVCAAKIADGAQAGRLLLRAATSRSDHIDGASYAAFQISPVLLCGAPSTSGKFRVVRKAAMKNFILTVILFGAQLSAATDKYFTVITLSGLNLRNAPSTNGRILTVIPFDGSGEILEQVSPDIIKIQGRSGFWVKVRYKNQTGFLFTGFAQTSNTLQSLHSNDDERFEAQYIEDVEGNEMSKDEVLAAFKKKIVHKLDYPNHIFYVYTSGVKVQNQDPGCIDERSFHEAMILNKKQRQYYRVHGVLIKPLADQLPLPNMLAISVTGCTCCCGDHSNKALFFGPKKVMKTQFYLKGQRAACSADRWYDSFEWQTTINPNELLFRYEVPYCSFDGRNSEVDYKRPEIRKILFQKIISDENGFRTEIIRPESKAFREIENTWQNQKKPLP
jgi:hypothetical protein